MTLDERKPSGDPVVSLEKVADLNEILMVRSENEYRAAQVAKSRAEAEAAKARRGR